MIKIVTLLKSTNIVKHCMFKYESSILQIQTNISTTLEQKLYNYAVFPTMCNAITGFTCLDIVLVVDTVFIISVIILFHIFLLICHIRFCLFDFQLFCVPVYSVVSVTL